MIFINSDQLLPGMVLAKDVILFNDKSFNTKLIAKGQVLHKLYIEKIVSLNIIGVYISNGSFDDIEVEPIINDALKIKTLSSIKKIFNQAGKGIGKLDESAVKQVSGIVDSLTEEVKSKSDLTNNVVEFKNHDDYTYQHCLSVSVLSILTGMSMGLKSSELRELGMSAMFHDIGKMAVPLEILNKPDKLTAEEFDLMKKHPSFGAEYLHKYVSRDILAGIEQHHENIDGSGYPYGKKNDEIHLYGKIIAICDAYDALTSQRSYKNPCIPSEAIEFLMGCVDSKYDYDLLLYFLKNITPYPVGTLVRLSNGKTCVVVKNNKSNIMRPLVRVLNSDNSAGENIDLLNDLSFLNVTIIDRGS